MNSTILSRQNSTPLERNYNRIAEEILATPGPEMSWFKSMLRESDYILEQLEQLNLDEKTYATGDLVVRMHDFFLRCGFSPIDVEGEFASRKRFTVTNGLDWIYSCQAMILGYDEENEPTPL
jgi:hypothetical protein